MEQTRPTRGEGLALNHFTLQASKHITTGTQPCFPSTRWPITTRFESASLVLASNDVNRKDGIISVNLHSYWVHRFQMVYVVGVLYSRDAWREVQGLTALLQDHV